MSSEWKYGTKLFEASENEKTSFEGVVDIEVPEKKCFNCQHLFGRYSLPSVNINSRCPWWLVFCGDTSYTYHHFKHKTSIVCAEYCASFLNLKFNLFFANKIRAFGITYSHGISSSTRRQLFGCCLRSFRLFLWSCSVFLGFHFGRNVYLIRNERCRQHNVCSFAFHKRDRIKTNLCLAGFFSPMRWNFFTFCVKFKRS